MDDKDIQEAIDEIREVKEAKRKNKPGSTSLLTKSRKARDKRKVVQAASRKRNR
jgi:hypothetical protein